MNEVTLKTLEKSFKENIQKVVEKLAREYIRDENYIPPRELAAELERYTEEVLAAVTACGGSTDDVFQWAEDVISMRNIHKIVEKTIVSEEGDS